VLMCTDEDDNEQSRLEDESNTWYDMIWWYDIFLNCNWVDIRWQLYSTNLHTNNTQNNTMKQNTQNGTHVIRICKLT
jgi:hypothetical protein